MSNPEKRKLNFLFAAESYGKGHLGDKGKERDHDIKLDLGKIVLSDVVWVNMTQDKVQCWSAGNTAIKLQVA
jgi:hypothetical protein